MAADCALVSVFLNLFKADATDRNFIDGVACYFVGPGDNADKQWVDHHCVHVVVCFSFSNNQCHNTIKRDKPQSLG